jgi:hypothetical protein
VVWCVISCRQAAEEGAGDFQFAWRTDGSVKDIQGALGGLRVAAGDQHRKMLMRTINKVCALTRHAIALHAVSWSIQMQAQPMAFPQSMPAGAV